MRVLADRIGNVPQQEPDRGDHRSVAVVGAGITGLVAAYELRRRGVDVTLYESATHAGGAIRTTRAEGFLAEHGPNSFALTEPVDELLAQLQLRGELVEASTMARKRYVVRDGRLEALPLSPPALLRSRLFSTRAKLRALLEPLVKPAPPECDESVASFARRRLGREVLDYAIDPFVSGTFAGDPETLSVVHAYPRLAGLERSHGSLIKGMIAKQREARASGAGPARASVVSFARGMGTLVDALQAALPGTLRLGCPVRLLHRREARWEVDAGPDDAAQTRIVDAVVMAVPAHVMTAMELPAALRRHASPVECVEYPPVSVLTLGFRRSAVAHPLDGFGVLVPAVEQRSILGALFTSSMFDGRAPDGHVTLSCFLGGARYPARGREGTSALVQRVMTDLRALLGVHGEPVFVEHVFWPRAIPQYNVGHGTVMHAADSMEQANPGLYLAGSYRHGVSVGDCVANGRQTAERVAAYLTRAG